MKLRLSRGEHTVRQRADDLEGAVVEAARRAVLAYEANGRDPQYVDLVLDRESFEYFYHVARSRRADFLIDLVQATADLTNILICMRLRLIGKPADFARDALLPRGTLDIEALLAVYSEPDDAFWSFFKRTRYDRLVEQALTAWRGSGSLSAFENAIRAGLAREAATGGMADMGYEPVLRYLMAARRGRYIAAYFRGQDEQAAFGGHPREAVWCVCIRLQLSATKTRSWAFGLWVYRSSLQGVARKRKQRCELLPARTMP